MDFRIFKATLYHWANEAMYYIKLGQINDIHVINQGPAQNSMEDKEIESLLIQCKCIVIPLY